MNTLTTLSSTLLLTLLSTTAFANGNLTPEPVTSPPKPAPSIVTGIIGGGWGVYSNPGYNADNLIGTEARVRQPDLYPNYSEQSTDLDTGGWEIYLGAEAPVWKGLSLGAQVGYQDFGKSEYHAPNTADIADVSQNDTVNVTRTISDTGIAGLLTARYTWRSGINVFAKAGAAYMYTKVNQNNTLPNPRNPESSTEVYPTGKTTFHNLVPEVVLGTGWRFKDHLNIFLSYTYVDGYDANNPSYDQSGIMLEPTQVASQNMLTLGLEISNDFHI